ncbi:MAG: cobalamin-dependent protein [Gemmatimonadota bacterium]|nr:MAG: cobalamin-dependent protein [Gemmatimonadota bacterium]
MRILFVDPAPRSGIVEPYEHLGLGYLCAALGGKGYEVDTLSVPLQNLSAHRLVREIMKTDPHILGFSVKEINARRTFRLIRKLQSAGLNCHITLGGHFPTFNHARILHDFPEVDSVVRGEGEDTIVELMRALADGGSLAGIPGLTYREGNNIRENPPRPLIEDLDRLPFPSRNMTPRVIDQGGAIGLVASRGCYANCSFCSIRSFYGTSSGPKWRARSPKHVVDEIEMLASAFPGIPFKFADDQFIGPGERGKTWALNLASEIRKRNLSVQFIVSCRVDAVEQDLFASLKEAGLKKVFIGVESGTQQGLDRFNKKTTVEQNKRALKILEAVRVAYTIAFIFFDPYSTMEDVKGNLEFLSDIRPYWHGKKGILSIEPSITVHKGTPIEQRLRNDGQLLGDYLGYRYRIKDRRIQYVRFIVDFFIRRVMPTYHTLNLRGKTIRNRAHEFFHHVGN